MLFLAFLGFTNVTHSFPLNDKFLHFTCFCIATAVFYFIFDVEECAFSTLSPAIRALNVYSLGMLDEFGFGAMPT